MQWKLSIYLVLIVCTGTKHWLPKEVIVQMNQSSKTSSDSDSTDSEPIDNVPNINYKKSGDIQVSIVKIFIILLDIYIQYIVQSGYICMYVCMYVYIYIYIYIRDHKTT